MTSTTLLTPSLTAVAALCAVVALILFASRGARWLGVPARMRAGSRMRIAETISLDAKTRLHLVAVDGRTVMLVTGPASSVVVGWLPEPTS